MQIFLRTIQALDNFIDSVTMYRSALYGLSWLVLISLVLSFIGIIDYSPAAMLGSLVLLVVAGYLGNRLVARLYGIPVNYESSVITALLLFFIMAVPTTTEDWLALIMVSVVATVSKYVLNWNGSHIFNPAAFAVLVASLTEVGLVGWWVAKPVLIPFTILFGFLLLRKVRKMRVFLMFLGVALIAYTLRGVPLQTVLLSFPVLFMGIFMLTDPSTSPGNSRHQKIYAVVVGVLSGSGLGFVSLPHVALLIGNIYTFIFDRHEKAKAKIIRRKHLGSNLFEWTVKTPHKMRFRAGQYMEWTLPDVAFDQRGNRRTFTAISHDDGKTLSFATRIPQEPSAYKKHLDGTKIGDELLVGNVAGSFALPKDPSIEIVGIAGGVGITPFVAMAHEIVSQKLSRRFTLYYCATISEEVIYQDIFKRAEPYGLKLIKHVGNDSVGEEKLGQHHGATFYIAGPPSMVKHYKKICQKISIRHIKTDYFSGY